MSETTSQRLRFQMVFNWGGVVIAFLGLYLVADGSPALGIVVTVGGTLSWLFAKRRIREVAG